MALIEIEKGVPVPVAHSRTRYPFATMEVGDSFFVGGKRAQKLLQAARRYVTYHKNTKMFRARSMDGGARIWRIE